MSRSGRGDQADGGKDTAVILCRTASMPLTGWRRSGPPGDGWRRHHQRHHRRAGVIRQTGTVLRMAFGELDGTRARRSLRRTLRRGRIDGAVDLDPDQALDEVHPVASNASIMALARLPVGKLRDDPTSPPGSRGGLRGGGGGRSRRRRPYGRRCRKDPELQPQPPPRSYSMAVDLCAQSHRRRGSPRGAACQAETRCATPTHALCMALKPYTWAPPREPRASC